MDEYIETTYYPNELENGTCPSCGEESDEIYKFDYHKRCVDCIEEQRFYEMTMRDL